MLINRTTPTIVTKSGYWLLLCAVLCCSACSPGGTGKTVPAGDRPALEQLAEAYRSVAEDLPTNPLDQLPDNRRRFVEAVFQEAGYDYAATLNQLGQQGGLDPAQTLHRDLAQLILLPTSGLADQDIEKIYSAQELKAVANLRAAVR